VHRQWIPAFAGMTRNLLPLTTPPAIPSPVLLDLRLVILGESRGSMGLVRSCGRWIPAFAGMTRNLLPLTTPTVIPSPVLLAPGLVILGESRGSMVGAELRPLDSRVRGNDGGTGVGMTGRMAGMPTTPFATLGPSPVILGESRGSMVGAELRPLDSRVRGNDGY